MVLFVPFGILSLRYSSHFFVKVGQFDDTLHQTIVCLKYYKTLEEFQNGTFGGKLFITYEGGVGVLFLSDRDDDFITSLSCMHIR